jgi:HlyD family secretion protein
LVVESTPTGRIPAVEKAAMNAKKIILIVVILLVLVGVAVGTVLHNQANVTKVSTAKVNRQDLVSIVSGTGQIKPKTYVNIGATAFGRITHLNVKEGDHVKRGAVLAAIENVQPEATVAAQQATIASSRTDVTSFVAAEQTAAANLNEAKADLVQKKFDYDRALALYQEKLIAKQDYDAKKAAFDVSVATLAEHQAALAQAEAQTQSQRAKVNQALASQRSNYDALDKTVSRAPFDGLVTNVPVREGETVVVGIQNAEGSTLMTLADMSVITAEVKVDETDIVNVAMNQPVDVTVDALPDRSFKGHVTEVGDQALLRTTGIATSQSTTGTEEAKDFKVVVTLDATDANLDELRPGLSSTAKITTAHKSDALSIPIQALVERDPTQEKALAGNQGKPVPINVSATAPAKTHLTQGVFILKTDAHGKLRTQFVPVTTGITGSTDIEVLSGLQPSDEIVTGRYKILRTLGSGIAVKRDNSAEITPATES